MPLVKSGDLHYWIPPMTQKGAAIYNNYKRYLLVAGPRRSGKTLGICDKVWRHAWDVDRAHVGVWVKYAKLAIDGGCWSDLIQRLEKYWLPADMGMKFIKSGHEPSTRQPYIIVSNRHGTTSRVALNSLDFDHNAEETTKGKRASMVWFNELSNFRLRKVFDASIEMLRATDIPYEQHQWIGDTNPDEEGEDSWIYKLFYKERGDDQHPDPVFRDSLDLVEVMIEDNTFLGDLEKANLIAQYRHDPDLYNRYIRGLWTRATTDSHFADVFRHDYHVVGDATAPHEEDWDILLPEEGCHELVLGWDIGQVNHAISFVEPCYINNQPAFKLLDELVLLRQQIGLRDLVEMVLEKMAFWEHQVGRPVQWRHWSDKAALDTFKSLGENYDAAYVFKYSEEKIRLVAAPKFPHSIEKRVTLLRRLLFDGRILVSARCQHHIAMFKGLRKGSSIAQFIDRTSTHKHSFDSLTYALTCEMPSTEFMDSHLPSGKAKVFCPRS